MEKTEFYYPSADGVHQVHALRWLPEGQPRGVVQLAHGMCEYIGRYAPFAEFLAGQGFLVTGNDHLGHGGTAGDQSEFGFFTDWQVLVEDVYALRVRTGEEYPGLPYFLLGHSMGSFVARTYLIDHPGTLTGCILSGTGQEGKATVAMGKLITGMGDPRKVNKLFFMASIGRYNNAFKPVRTRADWLCRDEKVVDAYLADPLCRFATKGGMDHAMMTGLQKVGKAKNLEKMDKTTPVYFFAGDMDPVGAMGKGVKKVAAMFRKAGCEDVELKLYPGGRHEMLNELNRDQVWQDTLSWLERHS